jgi:hypothetical protein
MLALLIPCSFSGCCHGFWWYATRHHQHQHHRCRFRRFGYLNSSRHCCLQRPNGCINTKCCAVQRSCTVEWWCRRAAHTGWSASWGNAVRGECVIWIRCCIFVPGYKNSKHFKNIFTERRCWRCHTRINSRDQNTVSKTKASNVCSHGCHTRNQGVQNVPAYARSGGLILDLG